MPLYSGEKETKLRTTSDDEFFRTETEGSGASSGIEQEPQNWISPHCRPRDEPLSMMGRTKSDVGFQKDQNQAYVIIFQ